MGILIILALLFISFSIISYFLEFLKEENVSRVDVFNKPSGVRSESFLEYKGKINPGETLEKILAGEDLSPEIRRGIISSVQRVFNVRMIRAGNRFIIRYDGSGLKSIRYDIDYNSYLLIKREKGEFIPSVIRIPVVTKISIINGIIKESLFQTILSLGETGGLADLLASLFEYDVDFNRDIRVGDSFEILVNKKFVDGKFAGYGHLIAVKLVNRGDIIRLVRFRLKGGRYSYFHPDGRAVKKMFLRCPLPFMRVTSGFGYRVHPVLGFSATHNGVDFGAPVGTLVRSSADGIVFRTGYTPVKGRYIIVSHRNNYMTHYYHLSGIKKGIRRGKRVSQGNIIGYVGNSGRSTGPHLHYGIQRGNRFINPLRLKSPSKSAVPKNVIEQFRLYENMLFSLMENENRNYITKLFLKGLVILTDKSG